MLKVFLKAAMTKSYARIMTAAVLSVVGCGGIFTQSVQHYHCDPTEISMFKTSIRILRTAVESVVKRRFGSGGPFNNKTEGPYKESDTVRSKAAPIGEKFVDCVATMAQYIQDKFGRFPTTVPAIFTLMYLQVHQLDTGFYDAHFTSDAYLKTHADHDQNWG
jgi:hypothetical protein